MKAYARIVSSQVVEIITVPPGRPLSDMYTAELVVTCVEVPAGETVAVGSGYSDGLFAPPPPPQVTPADLAAYVAAKQRAMLAAPFSYTLSDGSTTLTTCCDQDSLTGINGLTQWATTPALNAHMPTRAYYNADWSSHVVAPAEVIEFVAAVGAHVQALYDKAAAAGTAIMAGAITTTDQVDATMAGLSRPAGT